MPAKKPKWAIDRDRARKAGPETVWLFGLHAVRDALENPNRDKHRLIVTKNAADRLSDAIASSGIEPELADPRKFPAPLDPQSVHQGAALEVAVLDWGSLQDVCTPTPEVPAPVVVLLDRVTDPHNVGAILRSAEVFGASAVIAPRRHAAPETGALAKSASGALERQPYLRVPNLGNAMQVLTEMGFEIIGLDGTGTVDLDDALRLQSPRPIGLVFGAEGPGLRDRTKSLCSAVARIESFGAFGSLNVSNAVAVSLHAYNLLNRKKFS
ncbi:MAG: RNA methyltransferase [Pseudomonadota bacterium]